MSGVLGFVDRPLTRAQSTLGRYQLIAPLGQGGMGTLYLAATAGPADFRKLLVVKELRRDLSQNPRLVEMFLDEAKLSARLSHPNVVQTIEVDQEADRYFLSMEFLDGQPYSALWYGATQEPSIELAVRLRILCDALQGLHYAHTLTEYDGTGLSIVHRDVSPQNIFVTYDGQVKVVDFGIAKAAVSNSCSSPGVFKGKFGYAAPEQVRGEEVDARTDVFAMGVVLFEALTLRRYSDGVVSRAAVAGRLSGQEPRATMFVPEVDAHLAAICDRALCVDPAERFASAEALRLALENYLEQTRQRVETAKVKQVMARKFAAERRAMHRLIDDYIKTRTVNLQSDIRALDHAERSSDNHNQPTQVADLSRFVDGTNNETVLSMVVSELASGERQKAPSSPRRWGRGIAFSVLVLGLCGLSWYGWRDAIAPNDAAAGRAEHGAYKPATPPPAELEPAPAAQSETTNAPAKADAPKLAPSEAPSAFKSASASPVRASSRVTRSRRATPARAPAPKPVAVDPPEPTPTAAQASVEHEPPRIAEGADLNSLSKPYERRALETEF